MYNFYYCVKSGPETSNRRSVVYHCDALQGGGRLRGKVARASGTAGGQRETFSKVRPIEQKLAARGHCGGTAAQSPDLNRATEAGRQLAKPAVAKRS